MSKQMLSPRRPPARQHDSAAPARTDLASAPSRPRWDLGHSFSRLPVSAPQAKLTVNTPGDSYEQEADAVADRVMRMTTSAPVVQRECHCGGDEEEVQRKEDGDGLEGADVSGAVAEGLSGGGRALDAGTRAFMEARFGQDFSGVRVHTDSLASQSTQAVQARAYTVGADIAFRSGEYDPGSTGGKRLLAHELTHVVQQGAAGASPPDAQQVSRAESDAIQRYTVPGELACADVVPWLNGSSPYAPEWAETRCNYTFNGQARINSQAADGGGVQMTVTGHPGLSVSVTCPVDRPQWAPSARPTRAAEVAAWNGMRASLDAHEQQHRSIGQTWQATLTQRWQGVNFSVTGTDRADAMQQVRDQMAALQQQWQADSQAAQSQIDPFTGAVLSCPAVAAVPSSTPTTESADAAGGSPSSLDEAGGGASDADAEI